MPETNPNRISGPSTPPSTTQVPPAPAPIAYRLAGLETWSPQTKTETIASIADDIRATFMYIGQHVDAGNLNHEQTKSLDTVIEIIRDTDVANRRALERRARRLKREKRYVRREYRVLVRETAKLGLVYRGKVRELRGLSRELLEEMGKLKDEREILKLGLMGKKKEEIVGEEGVGVDVDGEWEQEVVDA
ncbi:hypothetical protein N7456_010914 [Penicillium angulare]|uniref:Uncharacterized protein n=1 Tax=Penicillium angulare TaxID=116970 RepID=A0A9W9JZE4_9EURO|nr:hypothetical protein N7456_010914 [Penicillium angulare]